MQSHYEKLAKLILSLYRLKGKSISTSVIDFAKKVLSIARKYCVEAELRSKGKQHYLYCSFGNDRAIRIYFRVIGSRKHSNVLIKRVVITDISKVFECKEDDEWVEREYEEQFAKTDNAVKLESELKSLLLNRKLPKNLEEARKVIESAINEALNRLGGCVYNYHGELREINVFISSELVNGIRVVYSPIVCGYSSFDINIKAIHNVVADIGAKEDTEFDPHCYLYGDLDEEC